ncbi:hypothetical protein L1049_027926 [Liquidambar formosana]|uniref:Uncharacterized protein n=1 Tax=Liquidambar formosana TaxID=63359 RepID=A0AAP0RI04_LIQFO
MDSDSNNCGICLSEEGKSIRGWIDICDHYFCFVCIMEWAKIESRCPICKRRFSTIRRPAKDGVFPSERIVNVPVRDQVYHLFGNTTISHSNPYEQVQCSVCHGMADESLLLLCDLCDSAAHTYCVGLGATVPEGDWFCHDCTVSMADRANGEMDTDFDNQSMSRNSYTIPSDEANVSIFDIVQESSIPVVERPPTVASSHLNQLSSHMVPDREISVSNETSEAGTRTVQSVADKVTESGARTLSRCRNVHGRVRAFRDNWNALRSGSLSFSSSSVDSGGKSGQKHNIGAVLCDRSGEPHSSSSTTYQQLTIQDACSGHNSGTYDTDKAWKMMDIAKSIQQTCGRTRNVHQSSKYAIGKRNGPIEASNINPNTFVSKSQPLKTRDLGCIEKHFKYLSLEKENEKHKSQMLEKQKQRRVTMMGTLKINEGFSTTHSEGYFESSSSGKVQTLAHVDACHGNGEELAHKSLDGASSKVINERDGSASLISAVMSVTGASNLANAKPEHEGFFFLYGICLWGEWKGEEWFFEKQDKKR